MFISKVSGRTSMELRNTFRSFDEQLRRTLGLLDGADISSFLLFYVPDDAGWPDGPGFDVAEYEAEYLQSAGKADAMIVEVRRIEERDGEYHQYALGRPTPAPRLPSVEISWERHSTTVPVNEVFGADEAATIYSFYFQHRRIPETYSLRELDLG